MEVFQLIATKKRADHVIHMDSVSDDAETLYISQKRYILKGPMKIGTKNEIDQDFVECGAYNSLPRSYSPQPNFFGQQSRSRTPESRYQERSPNRPYNYENKPYGNQRRSSDYRDSRSNSPGRYRYEKRYLDERRNLSPELIC